MSIHGSVASLVGRWAAGVTMKVSSSLLTTLGVAMLACAGEVVGPLESGEAAAPPGASPTAIEFVGLVNAHRLTVGCPELVWHTEAGAVALAHSADMADRGFFNHSNPDGLSPFDRIGRAGISYRAAGENIALTGGGAQSVLDLWLGSSGHRQNIERCGYTHHGVGLEANYWTHVFLEDPS